MRASSPARGSGPDRPELWRSSTPPRRRRSRTAGFELFVERAARDDLATAYYCEHFVCALPVTTGDELDALLSERAPFVTRLRRSSGRGARR